MRRGAARVGSAPTSQPMAVVKRGGVGARRPGRATPIGLRWPDARPRGRGRAAPEVDAATGRLTWRLRWPAASAGEISLRATHRRRRRVRPGRPAPWSVAGRVAPTSGCGVPSEQSLADLAGLLLRDGDDRVPGGRQPVVPHPVRPRLAVGGADAGAVRHRARALHAARAGPPAGDAATTRRPRSSPARSCTRCAASDRPARASVPAAALLRHRRRDPAVRLHARRRRTPGAPTRRRCASCCPPCAALPELADGAVRRRRAGSSYVDHTGSRALANQGWKDSHDSVQFADGRLAEPPIALCEVQAYAYDAAVRGAALLAAFGEDPVPGPGGVGRATCATGSREAFWVEDPAGGHVGDRARPRRRPGRLGDLQHGPPARHRPARPRRRRRAWPSCSPTRGSTPGSGCARSPSDSPRFSRLSYHGGTVWPHDTAIAVRGLAADGHLDEAAALWPGAVRAAEGVDYRLPELYGGDSAADVPLPSAYPAACRPQAWSAAAPLAALVAVSGPGGGRRRRRGHPPRPDHEHASAPSRCAGCRSARSGSTSTSPPTEPWRSSSSPAAGWPGW